MEKLKKEFLIKLVRCENNEDVKKVLGEYTAHIEWLPVSNNYHNFSDLNNLNPTPLRSLVEKITNAQDHTFILKALERGIDPKSPAAPQTINQACQEFYGVPEGDLSKLPYKKAAHDAIILKLEEKYLIKIKEYSDQKIEYLLSKCVPKLEECASKLSKIDKIADEDEDDIAPKSIRSVPRTKTSLLRKEFEDLSVEKKCALLCKGTPLWCNRAYF